MRGVRAAWGSGDRESTDRQRAYSYKALAQTAPRVDVVAFAFALEADWNSGASPPPEAQSIDTDAVLAQEDDGFANTNNALTQMMET